MTSSSNTAAPLTLTLFGPMQISLRGKSLPHLRSRKTQWLLALLVLRHSRPVEREWLAGTLWPDADQEHGFANLRPVLSDLRHMLGEESGRLLAPNRHTLQMNLTDADVDLLAFDAAIAAGGLPSLERAVVLYRGPLLEGCTEEWVWQERRVREQDCLRALDTLANAARTTGDHRQAADYFRRSVLLDPWSDVSRRGLMEALARAGTAMPPFKSIESSSNFCGPIRRRRRTTRPARCIRSCVRRHGGKRRGRRKLPSFRQRYRG